MKKHIFITASILSTIASFSQENTDDYLAFNDTVKNRKGEVLKEVIITSNLQKLPVSIGKSPNNQMDLPQAATIITSKTLENQQVNNLTDLLKNANGVYIMGTTGGYQEEIASRGFSLSSSNTFKNGIRFFNGMPLETSGLERAEFLKGSAAILYGNVTAGGILNLVTKKPKFDFGSEASIRVGSFNTFKPIYDVYGALNESKKVAFRLNGSYETADSFRNYVSSDRLYVNPSFLIKLNAKTELLVEADYTKDERTPDFGAGIINYEIVEIPRERFLGVSWGKYNSQQVFASATLTHKFSDKWNVNFLTGMRYYDTELFANTRPNSGTNGTVQANGDWTRSIQRNEAKDNYFIQQLDVKGKFATGKIEHQFLAGIDTEFFKTYTTAYSNFSNYDTINIFEEYNATNEAPIPTLNKSSLTTAPITRSGIYVQDLIHFSDKWKLLTGIRYSYQDTQSDVYTYSNQTTVNTTNYDGAFSPRVGLIFKPSNNHSLFASYSNSFDVNTGQDDNGKALKPSIVDQYEIGIKNKLFDERIHLNVTAYQITNDAFYQQSLANGNTYSYVKVLAGEVRSQGVEIDLISNPFEGLSILAGYSFNETKFTDSDYYIPGSLLRYNPKNTANLNANYSFKGKLNGLEIGVINSYVGERYAGRSTRTQVANDSRKLIFINDFYQMDATVAYTYKKLSIRTKLSNVFNELSYNVHDDNSLNPIAPRNYSVALNYTF
ncbi:TonB-dependent receptor [Flavobacterium lutivivi]|nr:TonB-dependent receptor [Flavobacterium lutivivi]